MQTVVGVLLRARIHVALLLPVALGFAFGTGATPAAAAASAPVPPVAEAAPAVTTLSQGRVSYWAYTQVTALARATPSPHARKVARLRWLTPDGLDQAQIYDALREERVPQTGVTWIDIAIPGRPNGQTGWVPASALGPLHISYGLILVDRAERRLTLYNRAGKAIFTAPVGVGRPSLPTPSGHYYVLERFSLINEPFLGPYALGTSAFAPSLSEWPGGGEVGIHGTDEPNLIPGDPSHGCIRLVNSNITRLWPMVKLGTLIEIK